MRASLCGPVSILAAGAAVTALAVIAPATASAGSGPTTPENHAMGSQIRIHEHRSAAPAPRTRALTVLPGTRGLDVSSYNGTVDWATSWADGDRFAWIKATEGISYTNPLSTSQATGAAQQGLLHGGYHFAVPSSSSGADQAKFFSDHGGGWSKDGKTLPGALDLEYNPYSGGDCYGLSRAQMAAWITSFNNYYGARWGRYPIIYTSTSWWNECVGTSFATTNPLWVAAYGGTAPGALPVGWSTQTVWQQSAQGTLDLDLFNGSTSQLTAFATSAMPAPTYPVPDPIKTTYLSASATLGAPTAAAVTRSDGGSYQVFSNGAITYSRAAGAHKFDGPIYTRWRALGTTTALSTLGYATGDGSSRVSFQRGGILNNPGRGNSYIVQGSIWKKFQAIGGVAAVGLPKSDEVNGRGGGVRRMTWFEAGAITWGVDGGTFAVRGAIFRTWSRAGSEKSRYGRPVSDEYASGRQTRQKFSNGYILAYQNGTVSAIRSR